MLKSEVPHEAPNPVSKKAPRVHHAARRRGDGVAACGARATGCRAGNWISQQLTPAVSVQFDAAFRRGLSQMGFVEGRMRRICVVNVIAGPIRKHCFSFGRQSPRETASSGERNRGHRQG